MQLISPSRIFRITNPVCAGCGASYLVRITAIAPGTDGRFLADEISVQCEGMVPPTVAEEERWHTRHLRHEATIKADRLRIHQWINDRYRFQPTTPPAKG